MRSSSEPVGDISSKTPNTYWQPHHPSRHSHCQGAAPNQTLALYRPNAGRTALCPCHCTVFQLPRTRCVCVLLRPCFSSVVFFFGRISLLCGTDACVPYLHARLHTATSITLMLGKMGVFCVAFIISQLVFHSWVCLSARAVDLDS